MPDTPDGTSTSNFTGGDVSLPNDQILSANQPSAQQSASPESSLANPSSTATPPPTAGNAPQQPAPGQQTPQAATQIPGKTPDLSKPQTPGQPSGAPPTPQVNPSIQRAGVFHDIAEALAGGPRFKYNVDEYGNMQKTQVPVSGAHLGLAIAMEALSGMAAGLGVKPGPGVEGRAAAAGFQAGKQQGQAQNDKSQQQAQQDYARKAQVAETNMRMWQIARSVGREDAAAHQAYIDHYKPTIATLQAKAPGSLIGPLKHTDFAKYNVTEHNAIPFDSVPRLDDKGNQVLDARGVPQMDDEYYAVKPGTKLSGLFTKDDLATAKQMGYKWADNDLVIDSPMELTNYLNIKGQLTSWSTSQDSYNRYFDLLEKGKNNGEAAPTGPTGTVSSATTGEGDKITFKNPAVTQTAIASAKKYNVPASMVNAVIQHESAGNPGAKNPNSSASGLMQLTGSTAKSLGVSDPFDIQQNIDGGTRLLADLLDKTKHPNINGDPRLAFAAYAAGSGAVDDKGNIVDTKDQKAALTTQYANEMFKLAGLANNQATTAAQAGTPGTAGASQAQRPTQAGWTENHPSFPQDNDLFQSQLAHTDGNVGDAIKAMLGSKDPAQVSAAKDVSAFLGGADQITAHDDLVATQKQTNKENTANDAKLAYDEGKKSATNKDIISRNENLISALAGGRNIDLSRIATMRAFDREIITNEVLRRNPDYNPGSIDRAIKLADEASDESKSGSIGNSKRNVNTAFGHMGEAADALNNLNKLQPREFSDYANKPMSWMNEHFGGNDSASQQYQAWKASLNAAATDWQNLLNNQHALTDHDKEVAQMVANPNATFGNAMASLHEMARTGAIRTLPLNQRWVETMHTPYPNLIEPQTIEALQKINDPATNNLLKDLQSGGDLVNGARGVGSPGKRVGDLLGINNQQNSQPQNQTPTPPPVVAFKPVPGNANHQYVQVNRPGTVGIGPDGKKYVVATGQPQ